VLTARNPSSTASAWRTGIQWRGAGIALVEFQIVALLGLLPLAFGLLQVALLFAGAAQLDYVAFEAAREGAMSRGDAGAARRAAVRAMVPQLARFDPGITAAGAGDVVARAYVTAQAESAAYLSLETERPETGLLRVRATRTVAYLSAEFLMGPHLGNNLVNLGIDDEVREAIAELGPRPRRRC
jgi:hypothetical protein